ncbi:MAG: M1 family metallopeptidase [Flavobacteriales bacterium]|nr:M1 family metallopeptidase [Flavobacteriales bacterium]
MKRFALSILAVLPLFTSAQENINTNKFRQLGQELPTPNVYRTASGAPGHEYYQQQVDYDMKVELDDETQRIYGSSTITYVNNSPDELTYLWLQLDQNVRAKDSDTKKISTGKIDDKMSFGELARMHNDFDGGFKIEYVKDNAGNELPYTIVNTMMRVDLPKPLKAKGKTSIKLKWWYNINDRMEIGGRSGYEFFPEDGNYLYTIAQWFPRLCVYNEVEGWQHKQFLGSGEFALPFGDYKVDITVPADHIVGATGFCQNYSQVLTAEQKQRFDEAKNADEPVIIVTQAEAEENEKEGTKEKKTWTFKATNVRDFAFATSRKFIWDAMGVDIAGKKVMAMSYYPKEGNPLWEQYSTRVVAHTLKTYSKFTIDYPYPVAISVHAKAIGMEYPMICFNFGRPEKDGTYSDHIKHRMIGVIVHEVGHNFFPMIINSDERQWTWMDEGLNSFVEYLTEKEWDKDFPARRGPAPNIVDYMKGDKNGMVPIMTNSESIKQFGNNAYGKPATALNILRETVLGRELFDYAFKEYARRWAFKHPTPADFFRTMEDASGVDLDWFWRGWFYTTDHCDQSLDAVKWFQIDTQDPSVEKPVAKKEDEQKEAYISDIRNEDAYQSMVEKDAKTRDFYDNEYDPYKWTILDSEEYDKYLARLDDKEKAVLNSGMNYYQIDISSPGGLVMPVILEFEYADGSKEIHRIPAEIWKMNDKTVSKVFYSEKELVRVVLDPTLETADIDRSNNYWPPRQQPTRFELYKGRDHNGENPMQRAKRAKERGGK